MGVAQLVYKGICVFSCVIQVIAAACLLFSYTKLEKPEDVDLKLGFKSSDLDSETASINMMWTIYNAPLILGIFAIVAAVVEILLIIFAEKLSVLNAPIFRAAIYIGLGCFELGLGGDLGIAAGSLSIVDGALVAAFGIWDSL